MNVPLCNDSSPWQRWAGPMIVAILLLGIAGGGVALADEFLTRIQFRWNGSRLAPIQALKDGYDLYYEFEAGPALNTLYGPFSFYPYFPATFFRSPTNAIIAGQLISVLLYAAPWFFLSIAAVRFRFKAAGLALLASLPFFLIATAKTRGLAYSAVNIHSDAPAVFFMALALVVLDAGRRVRSTRYLIIAALFAACSIWTKQTMVTLPFAMALYLITQRQYRNALLFFLAVGVWGVLLGLLFSGLHGFRALVFNLFQIASQQAWRRTYLLSLKIFLKMPLVVFATFSVIAHFTLETLNLIRKKQPAIRWTHPWLLYALSALFLAPVGLLGFSKQGGSDNSMTPAFYSCLMMVCALAHLHLSEAPAWKLPQSLILIVILGISLFAMGTGYTTGWSPLREKWNDRSSNPNQQAYDFALNSAENVYFPMTPLGILKAKGKLYHFDYGLEDQHLGGYEIGIEALRKWIPDDPDYLAFRYSTPLAPSDIFMLRFFPDHIVETQLDHLEGWQVFTRRPGSHRASPVIPPKPEE